MDDAGIDIQVLSHGAQSAQKIPADIAVDLTRRVNDRLHGAIAAHPTRFAGFAALTTAQPKAAADELERCVTTLGFKGAMIHGLAHGKFVDDRQFCPIYARAQELDVPIYLPRRNLAVPGWRINQALARPGQKSLSFRDIFCNNLHDHQRELF
jgi:2,3-dihydroxybenzoate decarboxylase